MDIGTIVALAISGAALLFSVMSPLLTAIIKIRHESKMYQKRFYEEHKHEVIEKYIQSAGRCLFFCCIDQFTTVYSDFAAHCSEVFMYLPQDLWEDAEKMNSAFVQFHDDYEDSMLYNNARNAYFDFCKKVSKLRRK